MGAINTADVQMINTGGLSPARHVHESPTVGPQQTNHFKCVCSFKTGSESLEIRLFEYVRTYLFAHLTEASSWLQPSAAARL